MRIGDESLRPSSNNFTIVRLLLANAVIVAHCSRKVAGMGTLPPDSWLNHWPLGELAVDAFFFVSGFLVYASLLRKNLPEFFIARIARVWPALAASVFLTVLVGMFVSDVDVAKYFSGPTKDFIFYNLSLTSSAHFLTGVHCDGVACNVNGSLWSIPWEIRCYLLVGFLSLAGIARPTIMNWVVLPSTAIFAILWELTPLPQSLQHLIGNGPAQQIAMFTRLWAMFALGIAAYIWRRRLVVSWRLGLPVAGFAAILIYFKISPLLVGICSGYIVLCVAFITRGKNSVSGRWPDYSYGMYIYAFPVMVLVAATWNGVTFLPLVIANIGICVIIAGISWHFIEKPALNLLKKFGNTKLYFLQPTAERGFAEARSPRVSGSIIKDAVDD